MLHVHITHVTFDESRGLNAKSITHTRFGVNEEMVDELLTVSLVGGFVKGTETGEKEVDMEVGDLEPGLVGFG